MVCFKFFKGCGRLLNVFCMFSSYPVSRGYWQHQIHLASAHLKRNRDTLECYWREQKQANKMKQNLITSMKKIHERTNKGGLVKCLILFCHENFMFQKTKQNKKINDGSLLFITRPSTVTAPLLNDTINSPRWGHFGSLLSRFYKYCPNKFH